MKKAPYAVRQGDVLIVEASYRGGRPKDATKIDPQGDVILAHGEVTGHAHRIKVVDVCNPPVIYFDRQAERWLEAILEAPLDHEEHNAVPILPRQDGYQQAFQVEEKGEEVRRVTD